MKHQAKQCLSTLLIVAMLLSAVTFSLSSCSDASRLMRMEESERAVEFMNLIDSNMNSQNSYTADMSMTIQTELAGINVSAKASGTIHKGGIGTEQYFTHTQTDTTIEMKGNGVEQTITQTTIQGFSSGKMYSSYQTDDEGAIKLWSEISATDYATFENTYQNANSPDNFMVGGSATRTCIQNNDKSWTATYTDFSKESLAELAALTQEMENLLTDVELSDVCMTISANKKLYPTSIDMVFEYALTDEAEKDVKIPTILISITFENQDKKTYVHNLDGYTQVDDLRVLTMVDNSLDNLMQAENAEFQLTNKQTLSLAGQSMTFTERKEGTFTTANDKFEFAYTYHAQDQSYEVTYKDGTHTIVLDGKTTKENLTDAQARMTIENILDISNFQAYSISNIQMDKEKSTDTKKVYALTFATLPDMSEWEELLGGLKLTGDASAVITIENGRMTSQEYTINATTDNGFSVKLIAYCTYTIK